ncbi:MAG: hypothetical protein MUC87_16795 [Bacteroidia bacterium]|jgi:hypothetical protein|nr:hypothetical protein [Bacteroidia bacterium]
MNFIDFLTGALLMNAMPHYVLGVWKAQMLSGFGIGNTRNVIWGLANAVAAFVLFIYNHGFDGFVTHPIFAGAAFILVVFLGTSWFWQWWFYTRNKQKVS